MLMIYLMAIWTLDLLPYTVEDAINTTRRLPPKRGHSYGAAANQHQTSDRRFNSTILSRSTTTLSPTPADNVTLNLMPRSTTLSYRASKWQHENSAATTPVPSTKHKKTRVKKKQVVRKTKPKHWTRFNNSKFITRSDRDLQPKSNMQVLQFYAQPLNTIELKGQPLPTFVDGGLDEGVRELRVLMNPAHSPTAISHSQVYMAPSTYANSLAYKTIPEDYVHPFKPLTYNSGLERPAALSPVPILDPYNVYKRNPKPKALPLMPVQPAQKFVATIRSVTPPIPIAPPPVTVTRVYKYTEDPSPAFKLPFLENEDPIDENLPILSAALDDRLNDRVASLSIRNYMTPPKLGQPVVYGSGPRVAATLPDVYRNEYHILSKFNENLHAPYPSAGPPYSFEEDVSGREKENYSEEEVKKALKFIQRLKKNKPSTSRGRTTFKSSQQFRKLKGKIKGENLGEDADEEGVEPELISGGTKKGEKEHDPFHISDDDDDENDDTFQVKSFTEGADKNQEESRTKTVKADVDSAPRALEIDETVPSVDNKIDVDEPAESPKLGVDNDGDDRVEFQMHGLGGAESYKFGYDTGKGENRQFRYEERDANGKVKGHFGYYDRDGKLQLFNYEADPEHGYHLEKAADH